MKFVRVKDGEDLIVVVSHEPSAYDPSGEVPATMQTFRIVSSLSTDVLMLVPILPVPRKLTDEENKRVDSKILDQV